MKIYLKWYYWYQNFWDELLLIWVLNRLQKEYFPTEIVIETENKKWLHKRLNQNKKFIELDLKKLEIDDTQNTKLSHLKNILWIWKYKNHFKVFGWWEVLNIERQFPHNWWNLLILYWKNIIQKKFILIWGIWKDKSKSIKKLYNLLLPKASRILVRENFSLETVKKYTSKWELYEDFSKKVLEKFKNKKIENRNSKSLEIADFVKKWKIKTDDFVLINLNSHIYNKQSLNKLEVFIEKNKHKKVIYFPCDMQDDDKYFENLKKIYPQMEKFDWTIKTLEETLTVFWNCSGWFWARLHFLYPLKVFEKPLEALVYKDKVRKLILW